MNALLSAGTGLSNFACSAEECLSWIIILLNILTVFYLVFCAWFRVTKAVRIVGYVWASALAVATVVIVALHACLFTILSAVFTGLVLMAVLSVAFDRGPFATGNKEEGEKEEKEKKTKISGCFVIHNTDDGKFAFVLYNGKKSMVCRSCYKYDTMEEAKKAVAVCRENGMYVTVENKTKTWIEFVNHPKFVMSEENGKFHFTMSLSDATLMLTSDMFDVNEQCEKAMMDSVSAVKSDKLYYSEKDVLSGKDFILFESKKKKEDKPVIVPEVAATVDPESDEEDDDESYSYTDEQGNSFSIRYNKSFTAKLMQSTDEAKAYYTELKNEILSYAKTRSRVSWAYDSVNAGRQQLVKFGIRGKTLCVYFALDPDAYADTKYKVEKMEAVRYQMVPCMYRIKNDRRLKYAKALIAVVCGNMDLKQGEIPTEDYRLPYATKEELIDKGLIKEVITQK